MDQLDEAVEVFGRYLPGFSLMCRKKNSREVSRGRKGKEEIGKGGDINISTHSLVLLIKVVDISVQDLDKQLD